MRIIEPTGKVSSALIDKLGKKLEISMAMLTSNPKKGGNPLLFATAAGKTHVLIPDGTPGWGDFRTAATDGRQFYWYPEFLDALSPIQTLTVLKHEIYHNLLMHPLYMKSVEYPRVLNIATDFLVNAMIEREWKDSDAGNRSTNGKEHPLWNEPLGKPITLKELKLTFEQDKKDLLENVEKEADRIREMGKNKDKNLSSQNTEQLDKECCESHEKIKKIKGDAKAKEDIKLKFTLVDDSLLGRTSMDIYRELKEWYKDLDKDLQDLLSDFLSDHHMEGDMDKKEAIKNLLRSVGFAKDQQRGTMPAEIEAILAELNDPTLDLSEFTDQAIKKNIRDGGNKASYVRFKRRFVGEELFYPKYMKPFTQILVLMDTSGSMSDNDISTSVSELKQFVGKANIYIVPVDAEPHWDKITKITSITDFSKIKVIGRGGTVFADFFKDYREKLKKYGHFDALIVLTDAGCDIIPIELAPQCDVGWLITSRLEFNQHFGKPIYLKNNPNDNF